MGAVRQRHRGCPATFGAWRPGGRALWAAVRGLAGEHLMLSGGAVLDATIRCCPRGDARVHFDRYFPPLGGGVEVGPQAPLAPRGSPLARVAYPRRRLASDVGSAGSPDQGWPRRLRSLGPNRTERADALRSRGPVTEDLAEHEPRLGTSELRVCGKPVAVNVVPESWPDHRCATGATVAGPVLNLPSTL
jgi:hypothetical protein